MRSKWALKITPLQTRIGNGTMQMLKLNAKFGCCLWSWVKTLSPHHDVGFQTKTLESKGLPTETHLNTFQSLRNLL